MSLGVFDIKILLNFVCCVDETQFGGGKMLVDELLHFFCDWCEMLPRYGSLKVM